MNHSGECLLQLAQRCMKHLRQMKQIHSLVITNGYLLHHPNAPSSSSSTHKNWMPTLIYNALIRAYYHIHNHKKVPSPFHPHAYQPSPTQQSHFPSPPSLATPLRSQAVKRGLFFDPFVLTTLLVLYARNNHLTYAQRVFEEIPFLCIVACNAMINAFYLNGNMEGAVSLFAHMPRRDVVSWTTMGNGFALNGNFGAAIHFFGMMMTHKDVMDCLVKPNEATYVSVLSSCANFEGKMAIDCGKQVHGFIVVNGVELGVFVGTLLINLYGKMGCLSYALNVVRVMVPRGLFTWNAMISSLASNGREKEALYLFEKMKLRGLQPNSITFVAVLAACACGKFVREGLELFHSMSRDFQVVPIMEQCGCVIDFLGRAGYIQEVIDIIQNMPLQPDASVLGAFLGACRIHGAIELGEEIGKKMLKLQTQHCGQYLLLSSMNAEEESWDHAAHVRKR